MPGTRVRLRRPAHMEIPDLSIREQPAAASKPIAPPAAQQAAAMPASAAAAHAMGDAKRAALQPAAEASSPASRPSWRPPEPDLSVRYQVNLGLPARRGDDFDTAAFSAAKLSTDDVAKFREHLKTCSALPE